MSTDKARFAVKVKRRGKSRYEFLTPNGSTTNLRVHAGSWNAEGAAEVARSIVEDNARLVEDAKVVAFG